MVIVRSFDSNLDVEHYPNEIIIELSREEGFEMAKYMEENASGDWLIGCSVSGFELDTDAMAFKLRWM